MDQQYLKFGRAFEHEFVNQAPTENRTIEQTLDIGWRLLSLLPRDELTRISPEEIERYYKADDAAISVAPTRTNLIKVRKDLKFAREGHEILDRKREVLTSELVRVAHEAEVAQKEVWALLENAYSALRRARITLGSDRVEWAALAANKTVDVHLKYRGTMGVCPARDRSHRVAA